MLTREEVGNLIFQSGISKPGRGGRRKPARVFTEQGVAMLASVLRSDRAVRVSIVIIRAFVALRDLLSTHRELAAKLAQLEKKLEGHDEASRIFSKRCASCSPRAGHSIAGRSGSTAES